MILKDPPQHDPPYPTPGTFWAQIPDTKDDLIHKSYCYIELLVKYYSDTVDFFFYFLKSKCGGKCNATNKKILGLLCK